MEQSHSVRAGSEPTLVPVTAPARPPDRKYTCHVWRLFTTVAIRGQAVPHSIDADSVSLASSICYCCSYYS